VDQTRAKVPAAQFFTPHQATLYSFRIITDTWWVRTTNQTASCWPVFCRSICSCASS